MAMEKRLGEVTIENAGLIFKNFEGRPSEFNAEGNRNFGLLLRDDLAEKMLADGWKVKYLKPRNEDEEKHPQAWISVKVKYGKIPPVANLITSRGKTKLSEDTIGQLDYARIKNVDLIIRPYQYAEMKNRPAGVSAYLKSIYVTIQEDALEEKYGSLPDADDVADVIPFE